MVEPESRRLLAVPIKNDKGETFALQEFKYEFADCRSKGPGDVAANVVGVVLGTIGAIADIIPPDPF